MGVNKILLSSSGARPLEPEFNSSKIGIRNWLSENRNMLIYLWPYASKYKKIFVLALIVSLFLIGFGVALPWVLKNLTQIISQKDGFKHTLLWISLVLLCISGKNLFEIINHYMLAMLQEIERTIDNRLKQIDTDTTPVVLVIDELAFLAKTSIGSSIAHTMERISTEGRKCAVYLLASSQTRLVARTGDSSVVRDTLTSAFVHRIKPKQANLLLQDKDEAEKVKKHIKQAGDVLLCPVNDESVICKMPFTTEADMEIVADVMKNEIIDVSHRPVQPKEVSGLSGQAESKQLPQSSAEGTHRIDRAQLTLSGPFDAKLLTVDILKAQMNASPLDSETWQRQLATASGVSETLVQNIIQGKKKLSARTAKKLVPYLFNEDNFK